MRRPFERPVLAVGGHLKNSFCLGVGDTAYPGPHIGDLEGLATLDAFESAVSRAERFLRIRP
jgi:hydrogenase maturation protein HypF